ncbi:MAG: DUF1566 domain-containing protein [Rhodocyclaceae bacterium]|jgi:hypothetical protein|nr:DUF1566 domain-containing protein [Rhodocyclaceae bacterium]
MRAFLPRSAALRPLAVLAGLVVLSGACAAGTGDSVAAFVRLREDGSVLSGNVRAAGKRAAKDWACTQDARSGLIWERKTRDGGLRDAHSSFTPYRREWEKTGRIVGYRDTRSGQCARGELAGGSCNIGAYVDAVNRAGLCGRRDWRLPTVPEVIEVTQHRNQAGGAALMPDLVPGWYWTSTEEHGGMSYPRVALLPPGGSPRTFDGAYFLWLVSGRESDGSR